MKTLDLEGVEVIEAALKKAETGDPNNAPFGFDYYESCAYLQGLATAYQHALEMMVKTDG
jgi:hypothetical protein